MIVSATGHRPPTLNIGYDNKSRRLLTNFAKERLVSVSPTQVVCGGAQGWDQAIGFAALELSIPYIVAIPFDGQESKWPEEAQKTYKLLLAKSFHVEIVSPGGYSNSKFFKRDIWMVDNSEILLALYNKDFENSGTGITVRYAQSKNINIINAWDDWLIFRGNNS